MLEQVTAPVLESELRGGVGEVDGAVPGDRGVVAEHHRAAVDARHQLGGRAVVDVEQQDATIGVTDDDATVRMELQTERPTTGVTHHRVTLGGWVDRDHASVVQPGENPAVREHEHVLGVEARGGDDTYVRARGR